MECPGRRPAAFGAREARVGIVSEALKRARGTRVSAVAPPAAEPAETGRLLRAAGRGRCCGLAAPRSSGFRAA